MQIFLIWEFSSTTVNYFELNNVLLHIFSFSYLFSYVQYIIIINCLLWYRNFAPNITIKNLIYYELEMDNVMAKILLPNA